MKIFECQQLSYASCIAVIAGSFFVKVPFSSAVIRIIASGFFKSNKEFVVSVIQNSQYLCGFPANYKRSASDSVTHTAFIPHLDQRCAIMIYNICLFVIFPKKLWICQ